MKRDDSVNGNSPVNRPSARGQETLFVILALSLTYHVTLDKSFPLYISDMESGGTGILHLLVIFCLVPKSMCDGMLASMVLWGFIEIMVVKVFRKSWCAQ